MLLDLVSRERGAGIVDRRLARAPEQFAAKIGVRLQVAMRA
jgi:hypothetical protein